MKKCNPEEDEKSNQLVLKIAELAEDAREEFDMIELIEDSIEDIFCCDLDCKTCTAEEQGACLQRFKKANLYWLRKVRQDEEMLQSVLEKMDEMRFLMEDLITIASEKLKELRKPTDDIEEKLEELKKQKKMTEEPNNLYV